MAGIKIKIANREFASKKESKEFIAVLLEANLAQILENQAFLRELAVRSGDKELQEIGKIEAVSAGYNSYNKPTFYARMRDHRVISFSSSRAITKYDPDFHPITAGKPILSNDEMLEVVKHVVNRKARAALKIGCSCSNTNVPLTVKNITVDWPLLNVPLVMRAYRASSTAEKWEEYFNKHATVSFVCKTKK